MKIYCKNCGGGVKYTTDKPNFCSRCGKPLSSSFANEKDALDEQDNNDNQNFNFNNINKLEVEIEHFQMPQQTLGNIMDSQQGELPQDNPEEFKNINIQPKQTNDEFMKEFQKEAGTSRPNG
jgi:hypothetical protein